MWYATLCFPDAPAWSSSQERWYGRKIGGTMCRVLSATSRVLRASQGLVNKSLQDTKQVFLNCVLGVCHILSMPCDIMVCLA